MDESHSELGSSGVWLREALNPLLRPGALIAGRYTVLRPLGAGGMGWVVQARDESFGGQLIALKLLYPHLLAHEVARARFRNEILISRRLSHPAIVQTYAFGTLPDGSIYISMELVDGATLGKRIAATRGRGLPLETALKIFCRIAGALRFAHQQGIIHRDLKAENVLIGPEDETKVADFGLAQALRQETRLTRVGDLLGTPYYMSPEQFRGERLTYCSDIYSLGILFYEMLQGSLPFASSCVYDLARAHSFEALPQLSRERHDLPPWIDTILARCTAKQPEARYQSMSELLNELQAQAGSLFRPDWIESGTPPRAPEAPAEPISRLNLARAVAQAIIFGIVIGIGFCRTNTSVRWRVSGQILRVEHLTGWKLEPLNWLLRVEPPLARTDLLFSMERHEVFPLLIAGVDPNQRNPQGRTPLHHAMQVGSYDVRMLDMLLEYGARPDLTDPGGNTPLHHAAAFSVASHVKRLVEFKADPNATNAFRETPLHLAARHQNLENLKLLLAFGADIDARDMRLETPLHAAVMQYNNAAVVALLDNGADVNAFNVHGQTPLMKAVARGIGNIDQVEVLKTLIGRGARLDIRDYHHKTAYDYAKANGTLMLLDILRPPQLSDGPREPEDQGQKIAAAP